MDSFCLFFASAWWPPAFLCFFCCFFCFIIGTITHNTVHHPIFVREGHNRIFQIFLSVCYGHPASAYVSGHNFSHHRHTQTAQDVIRTEKARFKWHLLNQLFFFFLVIPSLIRAEKQFKARMKDELPGWYRQLKLEESIVLLVKMFLLVLNWKNFLFYVFLPQLYCVWGIIGMNLVQHDGCDPEHPYNHSRSMTGKWINWLTFNNGYHGAHHMKPHLHWSLYPEFHRNHVSPYLHPNLEQKNLLTYLFRTYIFPGKRLHYDGNGVFVPELGELQDEDWIPAPGKIKEAQTSLGAIDSA
jgi:fatty acid desaturase